MTSANTGVNRTSAKINQSWFFFVLNDSMDKFESTNIQITYANKNTSVRVSAILAMKTHRSIVRSTNHPKTKNRTASDAHRMNRMRKNFTTRNPLAALALRTVCIDKNQEPSSDRMPRSAASSPSDVKIKAPISKGTNARVASVKALLCCWKLSKPLPEVLLEVMPPNLDMVDSKFKTSRSTIKIVPIAHRKERAKKMYGRALVRK